MRQHDSIIGRRISYNNNRFKDLTTNSVYIVINERRSTKFEWSIEEISLINDIGIETWYPYNIYAFLEFNLLSDRFIRLTTKGYQGITYQKLYEIFDRPDDTYYYFIDDIGMYVGIRKYNFEEISIEEYRERKLNILLE